MSYFFFQKTLNIATFQELVDKAIAKLVGWKANCLSKAGRSVLIQSHLKSLPSHNMQCFQLPSAISNNMDRINRDFFLEKKNLLKKVYRF